jgi:hypothetical protein
MSLRFLARIWVFDWTAAAKTVLNRRYGLGWYGKPTTTRLRERTAALIRERWYGRVIIATTIISSVWASMAVVVAMAIFKAVTR